MSLAEFDNLTTTTPEKPRRGRPKGSTKEYCAARYRKIVNIALNAILHGRSTVRHIYYLVSGQGVVEKNEKGEGIVYDAISEARWRGDIAFDDIIDGLREPIRPSVFGSYTSILAIAYNQFRLDHWSNQDFHVELWTEKDAIVSLLRDFCEEHQVTIRLFRGQPSDTLIYTAAKDFLAIKEEGRKVVVFYLGDFDPSGLTIDRSVFGDPCADTAEGRAGKLWTMMRHLREGSRVSSIRWQRIGILPSDLLNPAYAHFLLPAKTSDKNLARFIQDMDAQGINPEYLTLGVDALSLDELTARAKQAIEEYRDHAAWEASVQEESAQKAKLLEIIRLAE